MPLGKGWLVVVDAFSQYPTVHGVSSTAASRTIKALVVLHYPWTLHILVTPMQ